MLTFAQSILAARVPWIYEEATRQRLIRLNREGLISRHSSEDGRPVFAARDIAVFRAIEAVRGDRGDLDILEAVSTALYSRSSPDGTNGIAASIYWALGEVRARRIPVLTLARVARLGERPEWRGRVHSVQSIVQFLDGDDPIALVQVPLIPVIAPLIPHFEGEGH